MERRREEWRGREGTVFCSHLACSVIQNVDTGSWRRGEEGEQRSPQFCVWREKSVCITLILFAVVYTHTRTYTETFIELCKKSSFLNLIQNCRSASRDKFFQTDEWHLHHHRHHEPIWSLSWHKPKHTGMEWECLSLKHKSIFWEFEIIQIMGTRVLCSGVVLYIEHDSR